MKNFPIPLSVKPEKRTEYLKNIALITKNTGRLFLIAGDQKMEHLNDDFFGPKIAPEDNNPEHFFKITAASNGGVLATHLGLISKYGRNYPKLPYIVKINGKTNLGLNDEKDSSAPLWTVTDIVNFKKQSGLKIGAIGYTLYLGGKYEAKMLAEAAKAIFEAHQAGLAAILWVYPRGKGVKEEDIHTIAGGAGVAACLDADFVKIKYPYNTKNKKQTALDFQEAIVAAGKTRVICVGGSKQPAKEILSSLKLQLETSGSYGLAIGRNLHQRSLEEATRLAQALSAMILSNSSLKDALDIYNKKSKSTPKNNSKFLGLF